MCKRVGLLVQAQEKWHSGRPLSALSYLEEVTCFRQPRGPRARVPVALTDTVIVEVKGPREENGAGPGELAEWTQRLSEVGCVSVRPPRKRAVSRSLHQVQQGTSRKMLIICYRLAKSGETQI